MVLRQFLAHDGIGVADCRHRISGQESELNSESEPRLSTLESFSTYSNYTYIMKSFTTPLLDPPRSQTRRSLLSRSSPTTRVRKGLVYSEIIGIMKGSSRTVRISLFLGVQLTLQPTSPLIWWGHTKPHILLLSSARRGGVLPSQGHS